VKALWIGDGGFGRLPPSSDGFFLERRNFSMRTQSAVGAALLCAAMISGCCRPFDLRGKGLGENADGGMAGLRPPADERRFTGLDGKARDIERNLGVR
jgi:hypothetical protein